MKIVFIGCVQFSHTMLTELLRLDGIDIVGIVTRRTSAINADYCSLEPLALAHDIPCWIAKANEQDEMARWIENLNPDVIYCFGWSYLLKPSVLEIPALGVVGYHPTALPKNRGRHPIIWALALGLEETASTFFFMDEGADSGDILSQKFLTIEQQDNAMSLYLKLQNVAKLQLTELTRALMHNTYVRHAQDHSQATYWRKRGRKDGEIDWRMSAHSIQNLVRALTRPYVGAHFLFQEQEIKVWQTERVGDDNSWVNAEPGKVLESADKWFMVKCGEGVLKVIESDLQEIPPKGHYL